MKVVDIYLHYGELLIILQYFLMRILTYWRLKGQSDLHIRHKYITCNKTNLGSSMVSMFTQDETGVAQALTCSTW